MSKNESELYRDLIYFNAEKVQSILAQINRGLINKIIDSEESTHSFDITTKTGKVLELIGLPIKGEAGYNYAKSKNFSEEKTMHDFALAHLLEQLDCKDVSNLGRQELSTKSERTFVKVTGKFSLYDYNDLANTLNRFNTINKLMNRTGTEDNNDLLRSFAGFVENAYSDLTTTEITNNKGINFIGAIEENHLRETTRNMIYKYGATSKGDWEMFCQITNVPKNDKSNMNEVLDDFRQLGFEQLGEQKSMGDVMNDVTQKFSRINDVFSSVNYPDIAVEPIAIYQNINIEKRVESV